MSMTLENRTEHLDWRVEMLAPERLAPAARNPRTHTKEQIKQIANSIERFGFTNPVLIDETGRLLAGHGRVEAARSLEMKAVPALRVEHLSDAEKRAYVIADNRLAERAGWDKEILALELQGLVELDFPVEITGFEVPEIEVLLDDHGPDRGAEAGPEDDVPAPATDRPAVTRPGDLWILGEHRLLCGDARSEEAYRSLLGEEPVRAAITDPPYNVPVAGHVTRSKRHRAFAMASGEMTSEAFETFLRETFARMGSVTAPGALCYVFTDWRHLREALAAGAMVFDELLNLVVWNKINPGMGAFYRSQHELVLVYRACAGRHANHVALGRHGRNRSNVWSYRGLAGFGEGRDEALAAHPTVKPVAMIADALLDCTKRRDRVLDPFAGSGTVLLAAQKTMRLARAIEIDPHYCDVAVRRWQAFTGRTAIHAETGRGFDALAREAAADA